MSYNIHYEDLREMNNDIASNLYEWNIALNEISLLLNNLISDEVIKGKAADSIKNYVSEVHIVLIDSITFLMEEFTKKFLLYMEGFYNFEDDINARLNDEEIYELRTQFNEIYGKIYLGHEVASAILSPVSYLYQSSLMDFENYTVAIEEAKSDVLSYHEDIGEYDHLYATAYLDNIRETITCLKACIEKIKDCKSTSVLEYKTGDFISNDDYKTLYECMVKSQSYITENATEIEAAYEHLDEVYEEIEERMSRDRIDVGIQKIKNCIIGRWGIILNCVASRLSLNVIVSSLPLACYLNSNAIEGIQDVYYGLQGDPYTQAFCPIKDTICFGNQDAYDIFGYVAEGAFTVSSLLGQIKILTDSGTKFMIGSKEIPTTAVVMGETVIESAVTYSVYDFCKYNDMDEITSLILGTTAGALVGKITIDSMISFGNNGINVGVPSNTGNVVEALDSVDEVFEGGLDISIKNIDEFIGGNKSFDDVLDDYVKVYADRINSNQAWSWDDTIPGGENLTKKQRSIIKKQAIDAGLIPDIKVTKVEGMRYGFADFESAGVVKETQYLPENMWKMSDTEQFKWLDEQIGGTVEGYTWHHTEIPGKMQLVPTGIHNITAHNGGRTAGMWADAPR